ncbi:MAG: O-antigen polymerase [Thermoleophilia bacterium]|nr:O-antigen polymerase [Thermoleophilia bacterium]
MSGAGAAGGTAGATLRLHAPVVVLAAVPVLLSLWFGGYHPRHGGWVVLGLAAWACVQGARGRLSAPRSVSGLASAAMLLLLVWTTASIAWADASTHDAWVEAMRAAGYAAAFVLGGSLLANSRAYVRFATLAGAGTAVLGVATAIRLRAADAPLREFVAGRLDWPVGYAPGLGGMYLIATLLLLGASCAAQARWMRDRDPLHLAGSGAALGGAGLCGALAFLTQSRGTVPALLVGCIAALVLTPGRASWIVRFGSVAAALVVLRARFAEPFQSQFDLRQAPFTKGADAPALLAAAEDAARAAGTAVLVVGVLLAVFGAALPPLAAWVLERTQDARDRVAHPATVPAAIAVLALVATLVATSGGRSPTGWVADQWHGCTDPPSGIDDPGSGSSYFANSGTGRCDYYRVALHNVREHPLQGVGAGNFRGTYVRARETREEPRVAHSLPLQLLGELGVVGGLLGAIVLGCVLVAARRFLLSGPARDPAFAGGIAALAYWVAHASIDWLWQLPSVSLPAIALAGGLVACVSPAQGPVRTAIAAPFAAAALLASVALVLPVTMADAALRRARDPELRRTDPGAALDAAKDAARFDPNWAEAAITEGSLQATAGHRAAAADAGRRAVRDEPRSWSVQYRASGLIGLDDTGEGLRAFEAARRLNPQLSANPAAKQPATESPDADALG